MRTSLALNPEVIESDDDADRKITESFNKYKGGNTAHLTDAQHAKTETEIAKMAIQGYMATEIASVVGLHKVTVGQYLKKITAQWRHDASRSISEVKSKELQKLDLIEMQAWDAWERSKLGKKKNQIVADFVPGEKAGSDPVRRPKLTKTLQEDEVGDPKYLDLVLRCIEKRTKLLGMDSIEVREGDVNSDTTLIIEERRTRYAAILGKPVIQLAGGTTVHDDSGQSLDSERSPREAGRVLDAYGHLRETAP